MSDLQPNRPAGPASAGGVMIPMLIGAVLALMFASAYLLFQLKLVREDLVQVRTDTAQTREQLQMDIARLSEMSTTTSKQADHNAIESLESLKTELQATRKQVHNAVGQAKDEAIKHVGELGKQLEKQAAVVAGQIKEQEQRVAAANDVASQAKNEVETAKTQVSQVSSELGAVKTDLSATKADVERQVAELKSVKGDLSAQNVLIATNKTELDTLKGLGKREYSDFKVPKDNASHRAGLVQIRLKSADTNKKRYSIEVTIDDNKFEKKDRTINEPLQFSLGRDQQYIELVVNEVSKNMIVGYVSTPKSPPAR